MRGDPVSLLRQLGEVDRRIDNMRFLVRFQEEKRLRIIEDIRKATGREHPRTSAVRDATPTSYEVAAETSDDDPGAGMTVDHAGSEMRLVITSTGDRHAVHVEDAALLDMGVLRLEDGVLDHGWVPVARQSVMDAGNGWTRDASPKTDK